MKTQLFILIVLCISFNAKSQTSTPEQQSSVATTIEVIKNKEMYTPRKGVIFSNLSNINLTSEFGDNSASALMAFSVGSSSSFSFYFKQPFESKPKSVSFFKQDGLSTGTSAEIAFQHVCWKTKIDDALFQKLKKAYADKKGIATGTPAFRAITVSDFDDETITNFWADKSNKLGVPILLGAGYSVAKNEINYVIDSFSNSSTKENRTNHNLRFTVGIFARNRSVISLSAIQEIKYESGDPITMNFPLDALGLLSYTKDVTLGVPVEKNLTRFQLDYRQSFYKEGQISFAIAPSLAYRTKEKSISIEIPIYFINFKEDKKIKGLQGGISIGYTNKLKEKTSFDEGFALSIFIGAPFDLFGYFKTR